MSKKTIEVEIYQCDNTDESGEKCDLEGERNSIKECAKCGMDLCSRHYQFLTVTRHGANILSYHFCHDHANEFVDALIERYGDSRSVPYAGTAK